MSFLVEMVVDRDEFLQISRSAEAQQGSLSLLKSLM